MRQMGYEITCTAAAGRDGCGCGTRTVGLAFRCWRFGSAAFGPFVPPAASAHRNVPQSSSSRPVTPARLAKVPRLRQAVVVEVAELCVGGFASRAF